MAQVFIKILNMSIPGSFFIIAVLLTRVIFRKAPKLFNCLLWGLVGIRLLCPVFFTSTFSLIPSAETIPRDIIKDATPQIASGIKTIDYLFNDNVINYIVDTSTTTPTEIIISVGKILWIVGIVAMIGYSVFSFFSLSKRVSASLKYKDNIYICDNINDAFILGFIKPSIYLPSNMDKEYSDYVIAHEKAHLKRHDNVWKLIAFTLLTVYWFNPLVWVSYFLLSKDIELACDEAVIKNMDLNYKKGYSTALVECSVKEKRLINACPLAFGRLSVKERVKSVLKYKRPSLMITIASILILIGFTATFLTDPLIYDVDASLESLEKGYISADQEIEVHIVEMHFNQDIPYVVLLWENNTGRIIEENMEYNLYYTGKNGKDNITKVKKPTFMQSTTNTIDERFVTSKVEVPYIDGLKDGTYCIESAYRFKGDDKTYPVSIYFYFNDDVYNKYP